MGKKSPKHRRKVTQRPLVGIQAGQHAHRYVNMYAMLLLALCGIALANFGQTSLSKLGLISSLHDNAVPAPLVAHNSGLERFDEPEDPRNCANIAQVPTVEYEDMRRDLRISSSAAPFTSLQEIARHLANAAKPAIVRQAPLGARDATRSWTPHYMETHSRDGLLSSVQRKHPFASAKISEGSSSPPEPNGHQQLRAGGGGDRGMFVHFDETLGPGDRPFREEHMAVGDFFAMAGGEGPGGDGRGSGARKKTRGTAHFDYLYYSQLLETDFPALASQVYSSNSSSSNPFVVQLNPKDVFLRELPDDEDRQGKDRQSKAAAVERAARRAYLSDSLSESVTKLWMGSHGVSANIHFDGDHNFFRQVRGKKRFLLAPPSSWNRLNLYNSLHPSDRQSRLSFSDSYSELLDEQPKFYQLSLSEAVLAPGDLLYIPPFYFHFVQALGPKSNRKQWCSDECTSSPRSRLCPGALSGDESSRASLGVSVSVATWSSSLELARLKVMFQNAVPFTPDYYVTLPAEAEAHGILAPLADFFLLVVKNVVGSGEESVKSFLRDMVSTRFSAAATATAASAAIGGKGKAQALGKGANEICWKGRRSARDQDRLQKMLIPHAKRVAEAFTGKPKSEGESRSIQNIEGKASSLLMLMTYLEKVSAHVLQSRQAVPVFLRNCLV